MTDREDVISHLQIIHTWADFYGEKGLGIDPVLCRYIVEWVDDALALLKKRDVEPPKEDD